MAAPTSSVEPATASVASTALWIRAAASASPRNSSIIAAEITAARRVEVRRGGTADAAADGPGEVGEDVAEQVVGDDHVVATGIRQHVDARGVDVVVVGGHIGILARHLAERALPQVAREGEHIRL